MEINEFEQMLKNNVSELIAIQEHCQNTDVKCAQSILKTIVWIKEINEDIEGGIIPSSYDKMLMNSFDFLSPMMDTIRHNIGNNTIENIENLDKFFLSQIVANIDSYHFYKSLGFAQENTVVVGANGCGKTTLANTLQKSLNIKDGIVIPAQKLLIIPTFSSTPNYATTAKAYDQYQRTILDDKQTFNASKEDDIPYSATIQYGSEFKTVLATLYSERMACRDKFYDAYESGERPSELPQSILDRTIKIWNFLIEHRTLKCESSSNLVLTGEGVNGSYPAFQMSDGERIILYLVGRVLLAPEKALIIIDEPEMYLHKTIVDKLWNKLELERQDCVFLYLTHDLQFAASRYGKKAWIRSFEYPSKWTIDNIDEAITKTVWHGRMEEIEKDIIIDGAHNEPAIIEFTENAMKLAKANNKKIKLLISVVKDKEVEKIFDIITSKLDVKKYYLTAINSYRSNSTDELYNSLNILLEKNKRQSKISCYNSSIEAFNEAKKEKADDEILFCVGSLYLMGEILEGNR